MLHVSRRSALTTAIRCSAAPAVSRCITLAGPLPAAAAVPVQRSSGRACVLLPHAAAPLTGLPGGVVAVGTTPPCLWTASSSFAWS